MEKYIVATDNGTSLIKDFELTTDPFNKATRFTKIGDAIRECIRLNNANLGIGTFKVIPII